MRASSCAASSFALSSGQRVFEVISDEVFKATSFPVAVDTFVSGGFSCFGCYLCSAAVTGFAASCSDCLLILTSVPLPSESSLPCPGENASVYKSAMSRCVLCYCAGSFIQSLPESTRTLGLRAPPALTETEVVSRHPAAALHSPNGCIKWCAGSFPLFLGPRRLCLSKGTEDRGGGCVCCGSLHLHSQVKNFLPQPRVSSVCLETAQQSRIAAPGMLAALQRPWQVHFVCL